MKGWEDLDPLIKPIVLLLRKHGVETCQSCQSGPGHSFEEPTVEFFGSPSAGFKAYAVALDYAMPVASLRRVWNFQEGELVGPVWQLTFVPSRLQKFADNWHSRALARFLREPLFDRHHGIVMGLPQPRGVAR